MEVKYVCDIYNFWPRKYISASLKYVSNIFSRIYLTFVKKIYVKYILIIEFLAKIYFISFDRYLTYTFFPCRNKPPGKKIYVPNIQLFVVKIYSTYIMSNRFLRIYFVLITKIYFNNTILSKICHIFYIYIGYIFFMSDVNETIRPVLPSLLFCLWM